VSVSSTGAEGNNYSWQPSISADGRYVAFESYASNLVPGDTNGMWDLFVHDRQNGQTTRVSVSSTGAEGNSNSGEPSISADGRYVAFDSYASNLVPGDTNGLWDVFVHDRQTSPPPFPTFCTAKTALFCGAANIGATGTPSATATSGFVVDAQPVRGCRAGLLLYSSQPIVPGVPFGGPGDGLLCLFPSGLRRAGPIDAGGTSPQVCDGILAIDVNQFASFTWAAAGCGPAPGQNNPAGFLVSPGTSVNAQMWGHDSTAAGQVLSNGISWVVGP
jgi:hypothetical protein